MRRFVIATSSSTLNAGVMLRPALALLAVAAIMLCTFEIVLLRYSYPDYVWVLATLSMTGVLYVLAGVLAWDRRPSNRMGFWLVLIGMLNLVARLSNVEDPVLATVGSFLAQAPICGVLHLMLLFPSGRLQGRTDRVLVTAGYTVLIAFAIPITLFRSADRSGALRVADRPELVELFTRIQQGCWLVILLISLVILVRRVRGQRAVHGERRARLIVYSAGIFSIVLLPLVAQVGPRLGWSDITVFIWQVAAVALVPLVFVASLLVGGYARTGRLDELAAWLGSSESGRASLREALSETLGDDSLQLLFRRPGGAEFVDAAGQPVAEPKMSPPAGSVTVDVRGEVAAMIVYDTAAVPDRRLVEAAGRVVAVALDRDRLTTELLAEREALRQSRARIVEVGDTERRRLAQDLHDVLQSRLVLAAMQAGTLAIDAEAPERVQRSADTLRVDLQKSVDELRRLTHGVLPALLLERGLTAAARELVERCRLPSTLSLPSIERPLPPVVSSSAYFVLAEALTNAVKHSSASNVEISLDADDHSVFLKISDDGIGDASMSGLGVRGMADRVEALGGTFELRSRRGQGTLIAATIPYDQHEAVAA
jgi:signal transduction histidine kinase